MRLIVNCYFLKMQGQHEYVQHERRELDIESDGTMPRFLENVYSAAIDDELLYRKFDPRADWDRWATGNDPFKRTVQLEYLPACGLTYLDIRLHERALKHFPQLKVAKRIEKEEVQYKGNFADLLNSPFNERWRDTVTFPTKRKTKGPDTFVWKK